MPSVHGSISTSILPNYDFEECDEEKPFIENIQHIYESVTINKTIIVCISKSDCEQCIKELEEANFNTICVVSREHMHHRMTQFIREPNHILVTTVPFLKDLNEDEWIDYIMNSKHNSIFINSVPTYMINPILCRILDYHKKGFWNEYDQEYHIRWISH